MEGIEVLFSLLCIPTTPVVVLHLLVDAGVVWAFLGSS